MLNVFSKVFGTRNDRVVKKYKNIANEITNLEAKYSKLSDDELKAKFNEFKKEVQNDEKSLDSVLKDVFAITREASVRSLGLRPYDVQLIGAMVLNDGNIAEMKTGEGKTLVGAIAVCLNALSGKGVHVVTVNDYLATRDANELKPLYEFLGYSVGALSDAVRDDDIRREQYACDITYGTNSSYGFDFLRDNMVYDLKDKVQRGHHFVIVDEVDSILIDEARTPLIISGPTNHKNSNYVKANEIALKLVRGELIEPKNASEKPTTTGDFIVDEKNRAVSLTEEGHIKAEELFGVENLYSIENAMLSHSLDQALKANYIFQKDVDYVVKDDQIIIVDEFTGRLSEGRRFSEGLHQALEAKEKVAIQEESQTLADTTYQNYFRMYKKLSGMTGTAQTEATEFAQIYNLDVVSIPTNVPVKRIDKSDLIYKSEREKFEAVCEKIKYYHEKGQPVLVGTASIEKSEKLHKILSDKKIPHTVLNAKQHEKEGKIIADAGQKGAVTIATNMAGRGVDIKLTPEILALGGLAIIGTERHESRRIDNQLRGRSGRQGDVGESQFYLSLEDNLLRIFGSDRIKSIMERLGIKEGEFIESKMVTRAVENSQKKVEAMHFESRKHLLEYDDVANEQRKVIYSFRNDLLKEDYDISSKIDENRVEYVQNLLSELNITQALSEDEFDYEQLVARLKEELHFIVKIEDIKSEDYEALENRLVQILKDVYEQKMSKVGDKQKSEIERILYLQILDNAYREHLYAMDTLKTGIGLRGYNQKDPLVEYKKESYNMFIDLVSNIKLEIIKILFTIQLQSKEEQEALDKVKANMEKSNEHITTNLAQEAVKSSDKKIARNEVCPCGSGLKYKQCCGKSGPKRGLVAGI
ncbi:preprotein translocase subunit SecA [Aliarcobacter cryaerophilus]|jgi:preprotein translocase subunit SecA|uniref:Protein translocase subunit SecA n=3 Tax=Arcobacteraceae TaxID=2808963 RepID=A0AA96DTE4_9BACT|nr:preprotein translocase subunit SecA [Aliarcobacter cryaerophilus]WNL34281.1 preprotein translocase subunit SecA [Arcobacter sp. AZ-2023]WPD11956.1 preprotein translocase subunit SecA [Arcobacter sp. DSM 115960]AYJ78126.1 preprotein translocase, SecA subunit [Aliarcobacter cryaerophilus D2610]MCT7471986.1 preprotein translocase subunit SecA [Aliarcobacter cryaerophilus]MCT7481707.1 preprotein translocase subunit SecA [Aliarcobacter cryaerophilus]